VCAGLCRNAPRIILLLHLLSHKRFIALLTRVRVSRVTLHLSAGGNARRYASANCTIYTPVSSACGGVHRDRGKIDSRRVGDNGKAVGEMRGSSFGGGGEEHNFSIRFPGFARTSF
jgi:hypothetical protein